MCWYPNIDSTIKTADRNIKVYKICEYRDRWSCSSLYMHKVYSFNTEYSDQNSELKESITFPFTPVDRAFHSYSNKCNVVLKSKYMFVKNLLGNSIAMINYQKGYIAKYSCTIPKGSKYSINENGEYISDKIIINRCAKKYFQ